RGRGHFAGIGLHDLNVPDRANRRVIAGAHARRAHDAHTRPELVRQFGEKPLRALERTGKRIADAQGHRGRRRLAFFHHIEMRIEGCDLITLGQSEPHLLRQSGKMRGGEMTVTILNEMQMLDHKIAAALAVAEESAYLFARLRIDLTAFWRARRPAPA